ncbi:hypothetical protein AB0O76_35990 [Streptomyces sp. NPDC086554]|uniref:hypothetical protein n=1 Tax=Streptomyces sp. NPDC086554 TaxID=3154864 RepID=UPI00343AF77D
MPSYPIPSRRLSGPRRRSLLTGAAGAAGAVLLSGCSDSTSSTSTEDADERASAAGRLRARAARDSGELLGRYDAVLAAHPALAGRLDPLRAEVKRHQAAFAEGQPASPSPSASAPSAPAPAPSPSAPGDEKAAVRDLAKAERELAGQRASALLDAPAELARLLASVAAAGAAHAYLLTEDAK